MNKITKAAVIAAGVALACGAAHAQIAPNDLILGFNQQEVSSSDYIVDLGNISTGVGVGGTQIVDLSSKISISAFNSAFSSPNGVAAGFAGGNNGIGTKDVFVTQLRSGANPASVPGSVTPANPNTASAISTAAAAVNAITPLGVVGSGSGTTWSSQVAPNASDNTGTPFLAQLGINPNSVITGGTVVEDLYQDNRVGSLGQSGWTYDGFLTLTFSGGAESLTFTPAGFVPVPEPATYGWLAGAGLLALSLRRQLGRKTA